MGKGKKKRNAFLSGGKKRALPFYTFSDRSSCATPIMPPACRGRKDKSCNIIKGLAFALCPEVLEFGPVQYFSPTLYIMPFRVNALRFLLTYAQTDVTCEALYATINSVRPVNRAIICRERHADGSIHLHAAVEFTVRLNSVNVHVLDHDGRHPNIEPARSWGACVNYCRKEGVLETAYYGCVAETAAVANPAGEQDARVGAGAYDAAAAAGSIKEWFIYCLDNSISFAFANSIWQQLHGEAAPTYEDNCLEGSISNAQLAALVWTPDFHTLFICGPSGVGKTTWALRNAPTPFLLVTDIDDLGSFDPLRHKCIVFDEVRCTGDVTGKGAWPLTAQIKLATWDTPCSIRIRYKLARIPKHTHKIFTSTDFFPMSGDAQVKRRVHAISLYDTPIQHTWL